MSPIEQEVLDNVWDGGDFCRECPYFHIETERGDYGEIWYRKLCVADCAAQCPGARIELEALLSEFDPDEVDYLASYNPADPEGLFLVGYVLKFGGTYAEAKVRAERFSQLTHIWSLT